MTSVDATQSALPRMAIGLLINGSRPVYSKAKVSRNRRRFAQVGDAGTARRGNGTGRCRWPYRFMLNDRMRSISDASHQVEESRHPVCVVSRACESSRSTGERARDWRPRAEVRLMWREFAQRFLLPTAASKPVSHPILAHTAGGGRRDVVHPKQSPGSRLMGTPERGSQR